MTDPAAPAEVPTIEEVLGKHRQEHTPANGAARCHCGGWVGPYTMLPDDDSRSYPAHVAQALREAIAGGAR